MSDPDGPVVAKLFYEKLFENKTIDADSIAYALDHAVNMLRRDLMLRGHRGSWRRWGTFIHMGV
jgi:hypothetical protein